MYRIVNNDAPAGLTSIFNRITQGNQFQIYNLRNPKLKVPLCKTKQFQNSFVTIWYQVVE